MTVDPSIVNAIKRVVAGKIGDATRRTNISLETDDQKIVSMTINLVRNQGKENEEVVGSFSAIQPSRFLALTSVKHDLRKEILELQQDMAKKQARVVLLTEMVDVIKDEMAIESDANQLTRDLLAAAGVSE
jgi:hypothetical protein